MRQLLAARDNPAATVRIYRALPSGLSAIKRGDWVTLSAAYAEQRAIQDDDAANDWPIVSIVVPAGTVFTDGNDLAEYGYDGPALVGVNSDDANTPGKHVPTLQPTSPTSTLTPKGPWSDCTPEHHAASPALIDGTARAKLAASFEASGLTVAEIVARVGHSERIGAASLLETSF